jgi:hypothetical protein
MAMTMGFLNNSYSKRSGKFGEVFRTKGILRAFRLEWLLCWGFYCWKSSWLNIIPPC